MNRFPKTRGQLKSENEKLRKALQDARKGSMEARGRFRRREDDLLNTLQDKVNIIVEQQKKIDELKKQNEKLEDYLVQVYEQSQKCGRHP